MNGILKENSLERGRYITTEKLKVKMFESHDAQLVQQDVNEWLHQNKVSVQHVGQSQCERNGKFLFIISIFYCQDRSSGFTD